MHAIISLDPGAAQRFESFAPYEVRHIVRGLARLPHVHAFGATLFGAPVGFALATEAADAWHAPGVVRSGKPGAGRLLAITVARSHRRLGVGSGLLHAVENRLAERGVNSVSCNYALRRDTGLDAVEGLFRRAAWSAPEMTMLQCRADNALLDAPIVRELSPLPDEYRICDWIDVTAAERDRIVERQRRERWFPDDLDPFHFEPELEVMNSLALRYNGEVVGWLLTHSTTPTIIQYRCLFVRSDLARLGRGLSMLREAILRHWRAIAPSQGAGEWSTPASLPLMIRFIRRHLEPFGAVVTEQRLVRKELGEGWRAEGGAGDAGRGSSNSEPVTVTSPFIRPLLSPEETQSVHAAVTAARAEWTSRLDTLRCFTLGACTSFDAWDNPDVFANRIARGNTVLRERFSSLYDRLRNALASMLGAPVAYPGEHPLPCFRIQPSERGAHLPLFPIRTDLAYTLAYPGEQFVAAPVSFAVCITPQESAVKFWTVRHADTVGLDTEETARILERAETTIVSLPPGALGLFEGEQFHQFAPLRESPAHAERILLTGSAVLRDGVWQLFG